MHKSYVQKGAHYLRRIKGLLFSLCSLLFDDPSDIRFSLRSIFCTQSISQSFLYSLSDLFSCHLTCSYR